jgi:hypothetical protein
MPAGIRFLTVGLPGAAEELRAEVTEFLSCEIAAGAFSPRCDSWLGEYSPEFSRKLGERGWFGMTWPKRYVGHERSALERFVVTEELLAAGPRWLRAGSRTVLCRRLGGASGVGSGGGYLSSFCRCRTGQTFRQQRPKQQSRQTIVPGALAMHYRELGDYHHHHGCTGAGVFNSGLGFFSDPRARPRRRRPGSPVAVSR